MTGKQTKEENRVDLERVNEWVGDVETEAAEKEATTPEQDRTMLVCRAADGVTVLDLGDEDQVIVGRGAAATVSVNETSVSRRHAKIMKRAGALVVVDLGSRNGTQVGADVLKSAERVLRGGDVVRVGSTDIVVAIATSRRAAALGKETAEEESDDVVVADPEVLRIYELARKVARMATTVLICGETGAGKEVLAQRIHAASPRAGAPFLRVNCGAVPDALFESELFGHEKGAFTGADRRKTGYFEAAHGGTLLLDEIGELTPSAQVKLLTVLETRAVTRVGATEAPPVDVRVICATHRDLDADVTGGRFRADLYYRISSFPLRLPPLRDRPAEITVLAHAFARAFARAAGDAPPAFSSAAGNVLTEYAWPGNVRELRNVVEHAMVLAEGASMLLPEHFPEQLRRRTGTATATAGAAGGGIKDAVAGAERKVIEDALLASGGNQTQAAKKLGISRRALVYKLARYRSEK